VLSPDSVLVWPLLTRSGKGAAVMGAAEEPLGLAALPSDFPFLSTAAAAAVYCSSSPAAAAPALAAAVGSAVGPTHRHAQATGPVLVSLQTGQPLLAADGSNAQLSPCGRGFISSATGSQLFGASGQPLRPIRPHKTYTERVTAVLQLLHKATQDPAFPQEAAQLLRLLLQHRQGYVLLLQGAVAAAMLCGAAVWLYGLLVLPVCWTDLGGPYGCKVSGGCKVWAS
jgi:hypothetical protein